MKTTIRVAIVDDHAIVRQGLRTLLIDMGMEVVGEAVNGDDAVKLAENQRPDVMLLDIRMKDTDGLNALPRIKATSPETAVIVLTTYSNPTYFTTAIRNGASGYLLKESEPEEIVKAIMSAASHNHLFDPDLLYQVVQENHANHADQSMVSKVPQAPNRHEDAAAPSVLLEPLSQREHDVLCLLAKGLSNAAIADELLLGVTTVKTHVTHILRKLDVNDRTQAVLAAMRHGLVQ